MILLTRLNGQKLMISVDVIESMEETPDTIITLTNGKKLVVKESIRQIREKVVEFNRSAFSNLKK
ncbi:MAG: flagellar FlbD family protein [Syntrophomonadaceae bacterium]|nr:flagellar FlbD family protein [Syntrophomonadaceae bacterium]